MKRQRFVEASAKADTNALPLVIVALVVVAHTAGRPLAAQQALLQVICQSRNS